MHICRTFTQVVKMLVDAKFVSLEVQYIDGTKIEANANKYTFVWKKATKTNQERLDLKVKSILREAERVLNMELKDESDNVMTAEESRSTQMTSLLRWMRKASVTRSCHT